MAAYGPLDRHACAAFPNPPKQLGMNDRNALDQAKLSIRYLKHMLTLLKRN